MRRLIGNVLLWCAVTAVYAQTGNLKGRLSDEVTGEELVGAYVRIVGTYGAAISNADGTFLIENIKPGRYSVNISFIGYQQKIYTDIDIKSGINTILNVTMTAQTNTFETVKVVGKKI